MSLSMRAVVGTLSLINRVTSDAIPSPLPAIAQNVKPAELPGTMYDRYGAYYKRVERSDVVILDPENKNCANVLVYIEAYS